MRPMALKRHVMINIEASSNGDLVTLDQRKFKQVLYNLLSNAVKFSHENGEVKIIFRREGQQGIRLAVKDFGIGIKNEDLPRLFREFEQLDSGAGRRYEGTGLGLVLTKKIVELHGGS